MFLFNFQLINPYHALIKILTENILITLQLEAIFLYVLLDPNRKTRQITPAIKEETFSQLKRPEEVIGEPCWERIDVKNGENAKTMERGDEKKKRKSKKVAKELERKRKDREEREKREEEEKERLRKWEECWERKFQAQQERDHAECCVDKGFCVKPRTQSNIWINITQDRSLQEIHMSIK